MPQRPGAVRYSITDQALRAAQARRVGLGPESTQTRYTDAADTWLIHQRRRLTLPGTAAGPLPRTRPPLLRRSCPASRRPEPLKPSSIRGRRPLFGHWITSSPLDHVSGGGAVCSARAGVQRRAAGVRLEERTRRSARTPAHRLSRQRDRSPANG